MRRAGRVILNTLSGLSLAVAAIAAATWAYSEWRGHRFIPQLSELVPPVLMIKAVGDVRIACGVARLHWSREVADRRVTWVHDTFDPLHDPMGSPAGRPRLLAWSYRPGNASGPPYYVLEVHLWLLTVLAAVVPAVMLGRHVVRRLRPSSGLCPSCGYDLRATPQRCPECGTEAGIPPTRNQLLQVSSR